MSFRVRPGLLVLTLTAAGALAQPAFDPTRVEPGELDSELAEQGWVLLTKRGVRPTQFTAAGPDVIAVATNSSNALIYRELEAAGIPGTLSWEWQVEAARSGNPVGPDPDWPIAVYAAFEVDKRYIGWWQRFINGLTFSAAGLPASGKILTYTWSPAEAPGLVYPNPYIPKTGMIRVLQGEPSEQGRWITERRDLQADFEAAFGHPAERLLFIAISADGEDTQAESESVIRNIRMLR